MNQGHTAYTDENAFTTSEAGDMMDTAGELIDGRFAVVAEQLFDLTSYNDCANGSSYDIITVSQAPDCFNASISINQTGATIAIHVFKDTPPSTANRMFARLLSERMEEHFR